MANRGLPLDLAQVERALAAIRSGQETVPTSSHVLLLLARNDLAGENEKNTVSQLAADSGLSVEDVEDALAVQSEHGRIE